MKVKLVLRNPVKKNETIDYHIEIHDHELGRDWTDALKDLIVNGNLLEKNFCFMGFPHTARNLSYMCSELNKSIEIINNFNTTNIWQNHGLDEYVIEDWYSPDVVRFGEEYPVGVGKFGLSIKHTIMNKLHAHFETLQGTAWNLSKYYKLADYNTKYSIRQLNNLCHEIETLVMSQRKTRTAPDWVRPCQITTFLQSVRYDLKDSHRDLFLTNGYDRVFGGVYMHWTQIGKTLFEVFRDENAPELTETVCSAITELQFYSGEFDVEWGKNVTYSNEAPWHKQTIDDFNAWLIKNNKDPTDKNLALGYLPIGQVTLQDDFGTTDPKEIWKILSNYLDIYSISVGGSTKVYDYCWTDSDYKQMQIDMMKPGYDYSSKN